MLLLAALTPPPPAQGPPTRGPHDDSGIFGDPSDHSTEPNGQMPLDTVAAAVECVANPFQAQLTQFFRTRRTGWLTFSTAGALAEPERYDDGAGVLQQRYEQLNDASVALYVLLGEVYRQ